MLRYGGRPGAQAIGALTDGSEKHTNCRAVRFKLETRSEEQR